MVLSCLAQLQVHLLLGPGVLVAGAGNEFDEKGTLTNERYKETLVTRMQALRAEVS